MANLPLLVLPKATQALREKGSPKYFSINMPTRSRQQERLGSKFDRIQSNLTKSTSSKTISEDVNGLYPDKTIVFELAQPKANFKKALEKIGLSWIGEDDVELNSDSDFYNEKKPKERLEGRLYLTSPDQRSLADLLSLWKNYLKDDLPTGFNDWKDVFSNLKDIRRWGPQDRLPAETQRFLALSEEAGETHIRLEIEAVFFGSPSKDSQVRQNLVQALSAANAKILDSVTISEIRYHAVLISVPVSEVQKLQNFESALLNIDEIGYIRPQAMSMVPSPQEDFSEEKKFKSSVPEGLRPPVAALFDGVPVENHDLLRGRLILNDPGSLQAISPVNTRNHGTAMASLIIHGDLPLKLDPLTRQLYFHCLLCGTASSSVETTDKNRLVIGLLHDGLKNIRENVSASTKDIFIVNLSLGDTNRPFAGQMSAWARLLDYISCKYDFLFIVSAGNIDAELEMAKHKTISSFKKISANDKHVSFIEALEGELSTRTIFSPAEAINALTIGASHCDASEKISNTFLIDPFDSNKFPSLISGLGLGYKRSVKPDILHSGGRALFTYSNTGGNLLFHPSSAVKYFGQEVAAVKSVTATTRVIGTSNSAALVTRAAIQIYDSLEDLLSANSNFLVTKKQRPCLVKALLVHSAQWGETGTFLESFVKPQGGRQWKSRRTNVTRFLGYGSVDFDRVLSCTEHRVTLLGTGAIAAEKAEVFEFPLPPAISGKKAIRRLTMTLAWATPIRPGEQYYRAAILDIVPADKDGFPIGAQRIPSKQPPGDVSRRGTVVHEIFEGDDAVPVIDGDMLRIRVECRTQGTGMVERIPYSVVVTFEVADTVQANIYQEIASRIGIKPTPRVKTR
jgi:hypothetical protein